MFKLPLPFFGRKSSSIPQTKGSNSFSSQNPYAALLMGESGAVYYFETLPPQALIDYYSSITPVNTAVDHIANAVGALPIVLVDKKTQQAQPDHPAYKVLRHPNKRQQKIRYEFMRDYTIWRVVEGNAYVAVTTTPKGEPLEMFLLKPQNTEFMQGINGYADTLVYTYDSPESDDKQMWTEYYDYDRAQGVYVSRTSKRFVYHIHNFNSRFGTNDLKGTSELSPLYYPIMHYKIASEHNLSLLGNGARPSGAFILKQQDGSPATLTEEEFLRLKAEITNAYTGSHNAGRPMLLEGGLEWQEMQVSPKDLDFKELKRAAEDEIYANLGVPTQLVTSQKVTANNMSNFRLEFYMSRVLPLGENFCEHLDNFLLPRFPDSKKYQFMVDRDQIDVLQEQILAKKKAVQEDTTLTIDEKRAILHRKEAIKHGNKIVDPNGRPIAGEDAQTLVGDEPKASKPVTE